MKLLAIIMCLGIFTTAMAEEVTTDCPAMNQSREKNVKAEKPKSDVKTGTASAQ